MKKLNDKELLVILAALKHINNELCRCYWNKYQKLFDSPFDNTGTLYECRAFKVHAYDWGDDNRDNFVYPKDNFRVEWYKYLGRGMYAEVPDDWTMERLPDMMDDCINAIKEDFLQDE